MTFQPTTSELSHFLWRLFARSDNKEHATDESNVCTKVFTK